MGRINIETTFRTLVDMEATGPIPPVTTAAEVMLEALAKATDGRQARALTAVTNVVKAATEKIDEARQRRCFCMRMAQSHRYLSDCVR